MSKIIEDKVKADLMVKFMLYDVTLVMQPGPRGQNIVINGLDLT